MSHDFGQARTFLSASSSTSDIYLNWNIFEENLATNDLVGSYEVSVTVETVFEGNDISKVYSFVINVVPEISEEQFEVN